jgi:cell division protein FtsB
MVTRKRLRSTLQTLALYIGSALLIGYFWVNAHSGNLGLRAKQDLTQQEADLSRERDGLKAERVAWEHRVALLRPASVDPDTLDERAREMLDYAHPRDLILILKRR